jgi:hypothetical protein
MSTLKAIKAMNAASSTRYALKALKGLRSTVKIRSIKDLPPAIRFPATRDLEAKNVIEEALDNMIENRGVTLLKYTPEIKVNGLPDTKNSTVLDESSIFSDVDALKRANEVSDPVEGTGNEVRAKYAEVFSSMDPRLQKFIKSASTKEELSKYLEEANLDKTLKEYLETLVSEKDFELENIEISDPLAAEALRFRRRPSEFIAQARFEDLQRRLILHGGTDIKNVLDDVKYTNIAEEVTDESFRNDPIQSVFDLAEKLGAIWSGEVSNEDEAKVMNDFTRQENKLFKLLSGEQLEGEILHSSERARIFQAYREVYQNDPEKVELLNKLAQIQIPNRDHVKRNFLISLRRLLSEIYYDIPNIKMRVEKINQITEWIRNQAWLMDEYQRKWDQIELEHAEATLDKTDFAIVQRRFQIEQQIRLAQIRDPKANLQEAMQLQQQNDQALLDAVLKEQSEYRNALEPIVNVIKQANEVRYNLWNQHQKEIEPFVASSQLGAVIDKLNGIHSHTQLRINGLIMNKAKSSFEKILTKEQFDEFNQTICEIIIQNQESNKTNTYLVELHERLQLIGTQFHYKQFQRYTDTIQRSKKSEAQQEVESFLVELKSNARQQALDPTLANAPISHSYFTRDTVNKFFDIVLKYPEIKEEIRKQFVPKKYLKKSLVPRHSLRAVRRLTAKSEYLQHPQEKKVWLSTNVRELKLNEEEKARFDQIMEAAEKNVGKTRRYKKETGRINLTCNMFETREANAAYLRQTLIQLQRMAKDKTIPLESPVEVTKPDPFSAMAARVSNTEMEDEQSKQALQVWGDLKRQGKKFVFADITYGYGKEEVKKTGELADDEEYVYEEIEEEVTDEEYFSETDVDEIK